MESVRVLIVDDQEPFRLAAAAVVEATEGFVVSGAVDSGEAAVDFLVDGGDADLVLMDVNLPGMDGTASTRRLREIGFTPVVLLVSTYDEDDVGEEASACGAAAYVAKSAFEPDRLAAEWASATAPRSPGPGTLAAGTLAAGIVAVTLIDEPSGDTST
jgi:DNA-binding NarL/FixJ family response regulator